jgi:hypothetical protein
MASSPDCINPASLYGLMPQLHKTCKYKWPQAQIASNLQVSIASVIYESNWQVSMASRLDCINPASLHGLKPRLHQSCKSPWPHAAIASNLLLSMASRPDCIKLASLRGLKPKFHQTCKSPLPQFRLRQTGKCPWPKAQIASNLQVFMASVIIESN